MPAARSGTGVNVRLSCPRSPARVPSAGRGASLCVEPRLWCLLLLVGFIFLFSVFFQQQTINNRAKKNNGAKTGTFLIENVVPQWLRRALLRARAAAAPAPPACTATALTPAPGAECPGSSSRGSQAPTAARRASRARRDVVDASILLLCDFWSL